MQWTLNGGDQNPQRISPIGNVCDDFAARNRPGRCGCEYTEGIILSKSRTQNRYHQVATSDLSTASMRSLAARRASSRSSIRCLARKSLSIPSTVLATSPGGAGQFQTSVVNP